jgi:anti-sigma factor RsiW
MNEVFRCEDKETLVAYLYGEVESDVRREVERHLRTCAACTRESEDLQGVRQDLQLWTPPEPTLNFNIVQTGAVRPATVLTSPRWAPLHGLPAWAQVAAAMLFVGASAAIANVQVRSTPEGVVVTTGWMQPSEPATAASAPAPSNEEWRRDLVVLEQSLRDEIAAQRAAIKLATAPIPASAPDTTAVLQRVQSMIEASEERQRQEMGLRFAQAERSWNMRWTTDRVTLSRTLGNLQGRTLAVQAGQQEIMNSIRLQRVSSPQPNQ